MSARYTAFSRPGSRPASAVNQLDDAFASRGFHEKVSVRVLNDVEQWGPRVSAA